MSVDANDPSHKPFLLSQGLFSGIHPDSPALDRFIREIHLTQFWKGETIYKQGDRSLEIYLVRDGEIHLRQQMRNGRNRLIGRHGRGSLFGEVSFMNRGSHTTTAFVKLDSKVYCIPGKALLKLMEAEVSVARALARLISFRLHQIVKGDYKQETLSNVFMLFYPEDARRSSELGAALATAMQEETGGPILLLNLNKASAFTNSSSLWELLEHWPRIKLGEILLRAEHSKHGFDLLGGPEIHDAGFPAEARARIIPALLGRLKKYYTAILVDAGRHFEHPVLTRVLSQSDRVILIRNANRESAISLRWRAVAEYCKRHFPGFPSGVITISDEHGAQKAPAEFPGIPDPFHSSHEAHFRLPSNSLELESALRERPFRSGLHRLARFLGGCSRGICLGGGGARALAHIGVIEVLEEEGIDFDIIVGSSMGAVIGAAWARGLNAAQIASTMERLVPNSDAILDKRLPIRSFYRGIKLERALKRSFGDLRFSELPTPFCCNGCDLESGRQLVFETGYIASALRASVSLPGVYPPYRLGQFRIVDGGVINNLPGSILKDKGYKRILGVNVSPLIDRGAAQLEIEHRQGSIFQKIKDYLSVPPILKVINRSIAIQSSELLRTRLEDFDFIIHPNIASFDIFDFHRRGEIIESGRKAAREHIESIRTKLRSML